VPAKELQRFSRLLAPGVQVFTPYGATECLPVSSIGSDEILGETRHQTDLGRGVCVGRAVPGLIVKIIRISDVPIPAWDKALEVERGEIGEIAVKGPHVTRVYFNRQEATAQAKIMDGSGGEFYHRMGDLGYLDAKGRIWFCGRKSHRVVTHQGTFFTIPCEAIFNTHPSVFRSALVGVKRGSETEPVICVELEPEAQANPEQLTAELRELAARQPHTRPIQRFVVHPGFPVDIRHNAKIFREKLAAWASRQKL
jgi:acyl-CoA synthetase (AMP-forming)/AMP-acid ligase II